MAVTVYSNHHKDQFSAVTIDKKLKLDISINKHPRKRTNASNIEEEHALYAICENASVATAFLHHIGTRIANNEPIVHLATDSSNMLQRQIEQPTRE